MGFSSDLPFSIKEPFTKCVNWSEDRKLELLNDLVSIIVNNVTFGIGMVVHRADYNRVLAEEPELVPMALGMPYAFCAFRCFESGVDWATQNRSPDPINYVFEEGDQYSDQIFKTHSFFSKYRHLQRRYRLGSLTFDPKRNTSLQAADLLTWEINREFFRQYYPEPEYAYTRNTLVALVQRIPNDYKHYSEPDLRGYLQYVVKKNGKFFLMNIPDTVAEGIASGARGSKLRDTLCKSRTVHVCALCRRCRFRQLQRDRTIAWQTIRSA